MTIEAIFLQLTSFLLLYLFICLFIYFFYKRNDHQLRSFWLLGKFSYMRIWILTSGCKGLTSASAPGFDVKNRFWIFFKVWFSILFLLGIVFLVVFLLQNNILKKISQQQNASILNTSALFFFLKIPWILNLVWHVIVQLCL